jgi:hypothetical protein
MSIKFSLYLPWGWEESWERTQGRCLNWNLRCRRFFVVCLKAKASQNSRITFYHWDRGQHSKQSCRTLLGEGLIKYSCTWKATYLLPVENNKTSRQTYLTSQLQLTLWTEGPNTIHKPFTWWDHIRASDCMSIPGLDT